MKELLKQFSLYHIWANQKLIDLILSLPEEKQKAEMPSSFKSLYATVLHMWDAESIWWQRLKLNERTIAPSENFTGGLKDIRDGLMLQSQQWSDWIATASELSIEHVFAYQNSRKEQFKQPVYQMLHHVFNHATYHRGQLVNMLRQIGVEKIPQTDFILWSRRK